MRKRSGFICPTLILFIGIFGSVSAVAHERASTIPWENEPIEAVCFPTDNERPDAVCVTLYADQDGYELCVADMMASRERCVSNYPSGDPEDEGPEDNRWSVFDL